MTSLRFTRSCVLVAVIPTTAACAAASGPTPAQMRPIKDPTVLPFANICRFETIRQEGHKKVVYHSTGFLIGSTHALTAAHNFADTENDPVVDGSTRCGQFQNYSVWDPDGRLVPGSYYVAPAYKDFKQDYAFVQFSSRSPQSESFRLPRGEEAFPVPGTRIHVAGYAQGGTVMYHSVGVVMSSGDSTAIHHTAVTHRGMSGGPVWIENDADEVIVIGVHSGALGSFWNPGPTSARRLDEHALAQIRQWILEGESTTRSSPPR